MISEFTLIGYFPKRIERKPDWLAATRIQDICSVSTCISDGPPNWIDRWTHNPMWVYSTVADAAAVVPAAVQSEYEIHAYRMLSTKWEAGTAHPVTLPPLTIEPLPADFRSLGFDAVSFETDTAGFGHSPLSCNSMADEIRTNTHCLVETQQEAEKCAVRFSIEQPEPGPYFVVEVMRAIRTPSSPPALR